MVQSSMAFTLPDPVVTVSHGWPPRPGNQLKLQQKEEEGDGAGYS